jgi:hypothetical protein
MRWNGIVLVVIAVAGACIAGCGERNGEHGTTSDTFLSVTTGAQRPEGSLQQAGFVWRPDAGQKYGSDVSGRRAFGIVDGDDGTLFFQAPNGREGPLYSLYSLDGLTNEAQELVVDCYGMVNVSPDSVFYRGYDTQGVFCYDRRSGSVARLYDGVVENLLATKEYLYMVSSDNGLYQMDLGGGGLTKVSDGVAASYLESVDGLVYFAQMDPDERNCRLCKMEVGFPDSVASVCEGIPHPLKVLGTQVLYSSDEGVYLRDCDTREEVTVCSRGGGAGPPAASGNGIFYVKRDADGYAELCVFDLDTRRTSTLMPVHCGTVYFLDGEILLVNVTDLGFERVVLNAADPHTEWVVPSTSGPS